MTTSPVGRQAENTPHLRYFFAHDDITCGRHQLKGSVAPEYAGEAVEACRRADSLGLPGKLRT